MTLLERLIRAARARAGADQDFRAAIVAAKEVHSWSELADATGMSQGALRHYVREAQKGENTP